MNQEQSDNTMRPEEVQRARDEYAAAYGSSDIEPAPTASSPEVSKPVTASPATAAEKLAPAPYVPTESEKTIRGDDLKALREQAQAIEAEDQLPPAA